MSARSCTPSRIGTSWLYSISMPSASNVRGDGSKAGKTTVGPLEGLNGHSFLARARALVVCSGEAAIVVIASKFGTCRNSGYLSFDSSGLRFLLLPRTSSFYHAGSDGFIQLTIGGMVFVLKCKYMLARHDHGTYRFRDPVRFTFVWMSTKSMEDTSLTYIYK
jgi:hypothetical protein